MIVSRIMSRRELGSFKEGKVLRPDNKNKIGSGINQTGKYKQLKNGCFYFLHGDARNFDYGQLERLGTLSSTVQKPVLAVFEIEGLPVYYGKAEMTYNFLTHYYVNEIYVPYYSGRNAKLLFSDWNFARMYRYICGLKSSYSYEGEEPEDCYVLVPGEYQYPYKRVDARVWAEALDSRKNK